MEDMLKRNFKNTKHGVKGDIRRRGLGEMWGGDAGEEAEQS